MRLFLSLISLGWIAFCAGAWAHDGEHDHEAVVVDEAFTPTGLVGEWLFWPDYGLPGRDYVAPVRPTPMRESEVKISERLTSERLWFGQRATDRQRNLIEPDELGRGAFTVEFWVSYHVDQPIGAAAMLFSGDHNRDALWQFGFWQGDVVFTLGEDGLDVPTMELKSSVVEQDLEAQPYKRGVTRYWHHLVGVFDGERLRFFHQGELRDEVELPAFSQLVDQFLPLPDDAEFEIAGYLGNEPHMELGNLLKRAALYDRALTGDEIRERFDQHRELVRKGVHFRDFFHFTTSAPHLSMATTSSITISWETDRPASAVVRYGATEEMGESIALGMSDGRMQSVEIDGLEPNSRYFYEVEAHDADGQSLSSGLLQFRTAVEPGDPVVFAAISDTEARPHVNARLADLMWRESPHLIVNAGDLTDGGRHDHRAEWTHEYFAAMGHLMARVPVLPVMGNGEEDFVWFDRYHLTSATEVSYYNYVYGDVEFFVLDSNLGKRDETDPAFRERQRVWLEDALAQSTARWKVATHHHPVLSERYPDIISDFVGLYEEYGVDLVLVGHHHNYLRSWPLEGDTPNLEGGITYVQLGGGGGNLGGRPSVPDLRWAKTYQGYGYSVVSVLGDHLDYKMYDDDGAMRDAFVLRKNEDGQAVLFGAK